MYRTAASSIGGSKCHKIHDICSVAVKSASRNLSGIVSCGLTDPCSSALSPAHIAPAVVNPLETRMRTLGDVGNYPSELGALLTPIAIDLEARGFAIIRQGSSLPNHWNTQSSELTINEDTGLRAFGGRRQCWSASHLLPHRRRQRQRRFCWLIPQASVTMYRTAASSIGGSKCHKIHDICSVAVKSASRNLSGIVSCGLTDPCSSALSPAHIAPAVVNPLETRMRTLGDVGNYPSELGALLTPIAIDLEARGFAIIRQGSSLPNHWNTQSSELTINEDTGLRAFGGRRQCWSASHLLPHRRRQRQRRFCWLIPQASVTMYRTAASSIGGSKCHKIHDICSVAVKSASRNLSGIVSCGLTDPCSSALSPAHIAPAVVNPLETRMRTLGDVGNYPSELGALLTPIAIDLEARGFAIIRQGSSLPNHWNTQSSESTINEDTGLRAFGGSKMSERKNCMFQRRFSSHEAKVPVVRQVICYDDYDLEKSKLVSLRKCLLENTILTPISSAGLFRVSDLARYGELVLGNLGHPLLRQLAGIATVNLMRGLNVSQLIKVDNILWSPSLQCIVLDKTSLTTNSEDEACPYDAIREAFIECVEISTGLKVERVRLPVLVSNYLLYLMNAQSVDKRLITNHSLTRFPWERIHRNSRINQLLRHLPPKHILEATADATIIQLNTRARLVLMDVGQYFPFELLTPSGLHRVVDCWARQGQKMRGIKAGKSPIVLPMSPFQGLREGTISDLNVLADSVHQDPTALAELGDVLVSLHRDPFEHLYQPLYLKLWPRLYNVFDVDQLLNGISPLYGPASAESFMHRGLWEVLEKGDPCSKPRYCHWTNTIDEDNSPQC